MKVRIKRAIEKVNNNNIAKGVEGRKGKDQCLTLELNGEEVVKQGAREQERENKRRKHEKEREKNRKK